MLDNKDFTDIPDDEVDLMRQRDATRLQVMEGYCRTSGCLRNYILDYFGEKREHTCDNCGNCHREFTEIDMTEDAKKVINCVYETKGRYGLNIILGTLLGANRARLKELGTIGYKTYGVLKNRSEAELRLLINQMLMDGFIYQTADKYSVIRMGDIEPLKDPNKRVMIRTYKEGETEVRVSRRSRRSTDSLTKAGYELFEVLRQLRLTVAREEGMPPYIIFSDKTLIDMSAKAPRDRDSMLDVSGVGAAKYEKYGERFVDAVISFMDENPEAVTSIRDDEESSETKINKGKKQKKHKVPFYLNEEDRDAFEYKDQYLLSEIKAELNRITTAGNVKHIFGTDIYKWLTSVGYVEERQVDGRFIQAPTEIGLEKGITTIEQTSKIGTVYTVLGYPAGVQKEIVEHFIDLGEQMPSEEKEKIETKDKTIFNRAEYNRSKKRLDGAGASWSEEEDRQLDEEYKSGMKISEIAQIHDRTSGGIRARLKRHGLID